LEIHPHIELHEEKGLMIGGVPASRLARKFGTPLYVYSEDAIVSKMREYVSAFAAVYPESAVAYAGKAYLTMRMARLAAQEGLFLDTASGGELYIALQAGFPPGNIILHGNNKTVEELDMAVNAGVRRVVVDNLDEMDRLQRIARKQRRVQNVLLRLTPGIDPHTHKYLATGEVSSKFGVAMQGDKHFSAAMAADKLPNLNLCGFHCHIGSQIFEASPFVAAAAAMLEFAAALRQRTGIVARELDLGGGLGVRYVEDEGSSADPSPASYLAEVADEVKRRAAELSFPLPRLLVEPGRSIVGAAGVTLYTVGSVKELPSGEIVAAVDGGMADNPRPMLYGARYRAVPVLPARSPESCPVRIVGKNCEEGDVLIERAELPRLRAGDLLAVLVSGAYQHSMRSSYNALPNPAVVHVAGKQAFVVVERQKYRDLISKERPVPHFLAREQDKAANAY
jgi:diaminopimelate decarboxylase